MGASAVKLAEGAQEKEEVGGFQQKMIMIRQEAPRRDLRRLCRAHREKFITKRIHTSGIAADMRCMFVAGGGEMEPRWFLVAPMRRTVPRITGALARGEDFGTFLEGQVAPAIHALVHRAVGDCRKGETFRLKPELRTSVR